MDVHDLGSLADVLRQLLVIVAGACVARGMVVHDSNLRGIVQQSFAQDETHVNSRLIYSPTTDADTVYNLSSLVEQQKPKLLDGLITERGMEQFVDVARADHTCPLGRTLPAAAFAQLEGCHYLEALGFAQPLEGEEIVEVPLAECAEAVAAAGTDLLHQRDSSLLHRTRTDEDGKQLGIAESRCAQAHHLLTRAIRLCPFVYGYVHRVLSI